MTEPYAAAFTEQQQGDTHYITMLTPPSLTEIGTTRRPREVIFVQDTSGSMGGASIAQAKAGLILALLGRVNEGDLVELTTLDGEVRRYVIEERVVVDSG